MATGPFLPDSRSYNPDVTPVPYDPKKAAAILRQVGWKDSNGDGRLDRNGQLFKVHLLIDSKDKTKERTALVIRQAFQEIGVEIQLERISTTELLICLKAGQYEMALTPFNTGEGPELANFFWNSKNIGRFNVAHYKNTRVDSLFQAGQTTKSENYKEAIYREFHKTLTDDYPVTFLFFKKTFITVNRRLMGINNLRDYNLFQFVHTWYVITTST